MYWKERNGQMQNTENGQDRLIRRLYGTWPGRLVVAVLVRPWVSRLTGKLLSTGLSAFYVPFFCESHQIDLSEYEKQVFLSYNDFFTRRIRKDARPVDQEAAHLVSPCDSKLSVYPIQDNSVLFVKNTRYTLRSLLRDAKLAARYQGGYAMVFRLSVEDYHHYCYVDDGYETRGRKIRGVFHTVNPAANDVYPIYKENTREYSILRSSHFGNVLMMEVGAMMVGKIVNEHTLWQDREGVLVQRGQEKGHFEFGGSTVILLFEKGMVQPDQDILENSAIGCETRVKMGEKIGEKCLTSSKGL